MELQKSGHLKEPQSVSFIKTFSIVVLIQECPLSMVACITIFNICTRIIMCMHVDCTKKVLHFSAFVWVNIYWLDSHYVIDLTTGAQPCITTQINSVIIPFCHVCLSLPWEGLELDPGHPEQVDIHR